MNSQRKNAVCAAGLGSFELQPGGFWGYASIVVVVYACILNFFWHLVLLEHGS